MKELLLVLAVFGLSPCTVTAVAAPVKANAKTPAPDLPVCTTQLFRGTPCVWQGMEAQELTSAQQQSPHRPQLLCRGASWGHVYIIHYSAGGALRQPGLRPERAS